MSPGCQGPHCLQCLLCPLLSPTVPYCPHCPLLSQITQAYVSTGCNGSPPDSDFARHVIQVNTKLHALAGVRTPGGTPFDSLHERSLLVYSQPLLPSSATVTVPIMTAAQLARIFDGPVNIVNMLRAAVSTSASKRVLLNVAWTFPREREAFALHPFVLTVDTEHGTNSSKMHALTVCGRDTDNRNILAMKGFLRNLKVPCFVFLFVKALPHCLGAASLLCTNGTCLDGSPEQWKGFHVARNVGVFDKRINWYSCYFHLIVQELRDGSNLGISNVHPVVYTRIAACLGAISQTYRLEQHAVKAMGCLREYANNTLVAHKARRHFHIISYFSPHGTLTYR